MRKMILLAAVMASVPAWADGPHTLPFLWAPEGCNLSGDGMTCGPGVNMRQAIDLAIRPEPHDGDVASFVWFNNRWNRVDQRPSTSR